MRVATLLAAAVLSAVPVLAAHREVHLRQDVKLQGSVIPAGTYTLRWKDEGASEIEVNVFSGRNVVARATGTRVVLDKAAPQDAVVFQLDGQGGRELSRILSAGRRDAIRFETTWTAKSE